MSNSPEVELKATVYLLRTGHADLRDNRLLIDMLGLEHVPEKRRRVLRSTCPTCKDPVPMSGQGRCRKVACVKARKGAL